MINVHNRPIAMIIHKCITLIYICDSVDHVASQFEVTESMSHDKS